MKATYARERLLLGFMVGWLCVLASPAHAQVNVQIGIPLPPPLVFSAPPQVVVLPETYVYVVPDIDEDVFFFDGWWWRQWQGHWYRSQYYDRGWDYYSSVPSFYSEVPQDWRHEYREHQWRGRPWNYERMPHEQVEKNWNTWRRTNYWEHHQTWGVQGLTPQRQEHGHPPQGAQFERRGQQPRVQQQERRGQPQAEQPEHHGQQPPVQQQQQQQERHGQRPHVQQQERHGQPRPAQEPRSQQPKERQGHQGQARPDRGQDEGRGKAAQ